MTSYLRLQDKLGADAAAVVDVLMVGTGEYTTGFSGGGSANKSDKSSGVVALSVLDMKSRGKVGRAAMCGVNGTKLPAIREHMRSCITEAYAGSGLDASAVETFPADDKVDPDAYKAAVKSFRRGDVAFVFTPDDTHFDIAAECVERGMHVMVTKPIVQTLEQHQKLAEAAARNNVLVAVEVHKRLDPFYSDARDRALALGDFNYLYAYMSQPKFQLETFRSWAGRSSDISYYLNSHHVDWSEWTLRGLPARPVRVAAFASTGIAARILEDRPNIEDSITLNVTWINLKTKNVGIAVYTSSWAVPKSDVHSQQRFHYVSAGGEIAVDQAHRGCTVATDADGYASVNPLFMKYAPRAVGGKAEFAGQGTYGVRSLENFVDACRAVNAGMASPKDFDDTGPIGSSMATVHTTLQGTAILEAGRRSLDLGGRPVDILYDADDSLEPSRLEPHAYGPPSGP